jgi:anthranilate synthase component II
MILLIDNYDSFTFNLYHFLGDVDAAGGSFDCQVWRNDKLSVDQALALQPEAIVLSPGPCTPNEAGICLDLIKAAAGKIPLLGVCLGHQAIGQAFGGTVARAPEPMHGKVSVERDTLPESLVATAWTEDGLIMAMHHRTMPLYGVQFHPESIASEHGHAILANFLAIARGTNAPARAA